MSASAAVVGRASSKSPSLAATGADVSPTASPGKAGFPSFMFSPQLAMAGRSGG
ncbi:hypothetical protein [Streptomyces sp. NPDC001508]|uniref:hypothetical protein n=1 Tax=Streptomyces sp. NPDC001508 TaxID=3154656 RepID=UPI00332845A9